MKKQTINIDGMNIAFVDSHDPQNPQESVLVLVHGYLASSFVFKDVYNALIKHHRVIALDLPGFGDSEKVSPSRAAYDRPFFATTVWHLLDELGVTNPITLLGHSMGGGVVSQMTLDQQSRVEKLIMLDAMGIEIPPPFLGKVVMNPVIGKAIFMKVYNRFLLKQYLLGDVFFRKEACTEALVDDMWRPLSTAEGKSTAYATLQNTVHPDTIKAHQPHLSNLDVETHLIWGEEDRIHPPQRCGAAMKKAMGAKSFTVLAGVGHSPPEEAPEAFLQALTEVTQCNYLEQS
jgi:pimeloyl-ACP methyl ester carboxylesterase